MNCTAKQAARLFLRDVVKYWSVPRTIINDRDPRFMGKFWTELFNLLGSNLHFSTSFHPQTDGQTERVNNLLELYLRHFVSANQRDWAKLLDVAQFSYNLQKSGATHHSPFELATGQQPLTPQTVIVTPPDPTRLDRPRERHSGFQKLSKFILYISNSFIFRIFQNLFLQINLKSI
ncbi:hypothetical protein ACOSP7_020616 [Xanthoceras sorbifolium]